MQKHERLITILAPTLLGVIYIVLCATHLQQSVWFDESYSAYLTRFSFGDIWNLTAADVHPPLFYFFLKVWSMVFGGTDFGMRFMSVFFGAIAIIFAWQWVKRKFGFRPALVATALMALSPMLIRYGQEMRMYTMAAAIIFGSTYVLQLAIDLKKRKYWIIYGVLIALGMWTHYFTALIFLTHLAYLIYTYRKKIFQKNIIISYILATVLYLPWLPVFINQSATTEGGVWIGTPNANTVTNYFTNTALYCESSEVEGWLLILALIVFGCTIFLTQKLDKRATLLKFMAFLPPVAMLIFSVTPLHLTLTNRYVIYSMICVSLIAGIAIATIKFRSKFTPIIMSIIFVSASIIGIVNVNSAGEDGLCVRSKTNAKELFNYISEISDEGEPIINNAELFIYYDLAFYSTEQHPVYFVDELFGYEWGSHRPLEWYDYGKIKDLDTFLNEHEKVWYVGSLPAEGDLVFPREGYKILQRVILNANVGDEAPYQALELSKTSENNLIIEHEL